MAEPFPISGSIDPRGFPFLLMDLHRNGATGSLKVEGPSYQKALYFRGGRILFGSSNDPRDQLGAILIENGKITPEQLEEVNTKVGPGSPLAKVLAETGFVSQRELSEAARAKVERILSDVIAYTSGSFEFEDGVLPKGAVDLKLSTERLVLAAVHRVADAELVGRHLDSLDAVLVPTPALAVSASELQGEDRGLAGQIDGRRSVRQAAAGAGLEDDEAGRIACGLLFLGLLERSRAAAEAPAFMAADEDDELDLGQTARMAFADREPGTVPMGQVLAEPQGESPFFVPEVPAGADDTNPPVAMRFDPSPEPEPAPTGFEVVGAPPISFEPDSRPATLPFGPAPDDGGPIVVEPSVEPTGFDLRPPGGDFQMSPTPPEPLSPLPEQEPSRLHAGTPPAPPARTPPRGAISPGGRGTAEAMSPPVGPRPSREDLAALDALLSTPPVEGPLDPLEATAAEERWEPQPVPRHHDTRPFAPQAYTRRVSRAPLFVAIAATAAAALALGALGWRYFSGPKPQPAAGSRAAAPPMATPPVPTPTVPPPADTGVSPAPQFPVDPSAGTQPATAPPPSNAATSPVPEPEPSAPATDELGVARSLLLDGRFPEAADGFAATLRRVPAGTTSVQLLVACSSETVQKAVQNVSSADLFIVPVSFRGRDCYRVCWGLYSSPSDAESATRSVPEYFTKGGASPRVVSASEILP